MRLNRDLVSLLKDQNNRLENTKLNFKNTKVNINFNLWKNFLSITVNRQKLEKFNRQPSNIPY